MPTITALRLSCALLCRRCERGDHSRDHGPLGCAALVMLPPRDFVCACEVRRGPVVLSALPEIEEDDDA